MSSEDRISEVVDELKYGHPETRKAAAIKLGRIRDHKVIPHLIKAVKNDDYSWTRISAIQSLAWIADSSIISTLIEAALHDSDTLVRKTAIEALGNLKDESALDPLISIVNDPTSPTDVKNSASVAIQVIQGITPTWSQDS
ncbi:MAG: HEAT repeat domain-containing protein [Candidatus Kariarchaeaceae archaeon]|jgi:HEAT repeat protein